LVNGEELAPDNDVEPSAIRTRFVYNEWVALGRPTVRSIQSGKYTRREPHAPQHPLGSSSSNVPLAPSYLSPLAWEDPQTPPHPSQSALERNTRLESGSFTEDADVEEDDREDSVNPQRQKLDDKVVKKKQRQEAKRLQKGQAQNAYTSFTSTHRKEIHSLLSTLHRQISEYSRAHNLNPQTVGKELEINLEVIGFTPWTAFQRLMGLVRGQGKT